MTKICLFCAIVHSDINERIVNETELTFVIRDGFPVSAGHTLMIPKRHVASLFYLTPAEHSDLFEQLTLSKNALDFEYQPDAYNRLMMSENKSSMLSTSLSILLANVSEIKSNFLSKLFEQLWSILSNLVFINRLDFFNFSLITEVGTSRITEKTLLNVNI